MTDFCLFSGQSSPYAAIPQPPASPAGRACNAKFMVQSPSLSSVETRQSWVVATVVLVVMAVAFGAPWITVVALKNIAAEVNGERSIPAFAGALVWVGAGLGGIIMGRVAERVGVRWTVIGGAAMIAVGLALSTLGPSLPLYVGHGFFIGLIGIGGINAPSYVYVSRWFDRRRGSALALISSGSFLAGAIWPSIFERVIAYAGWRHTMLFYAAIELVLIVPAAAIVLGEPPDTPHHAAVSGTARAQKKSVLGWPANLVFTLQMFAIFTCCVPMSMPQAHLVAFCSDLGISPVHGAAMLSVLLGSAFLSRQVWGALSDRIGGSTPCWSARHARRRACRCSCSPRTSSGCLRFPRCSASASVGLFPPMCWPRANCSRSARPIGVFRRCSCAAARAWRRAVGSAAFSTIISAITRRPLPPASASAR